MSLLERLKWWVAPKEMGELHRWRSQWEEHRRWLAEFEHTSATLDQMKMGEYMAAQMDRQIEGAISTNEALCNENEYLAEMLRWAYGKLHGRTFINIDDALMADRIKLWLEHGIAG